MKAMITLLALSLSTAAMATELNAYEISAVTANNQLVMNVEGKAAQTLFFSLNVESTKTFGIVQTETKIGKNVACASTIMGDIPGQMTAPVYNCTVIVDLK